MNGTKSNRRYWRGTLTVGALILMTLVLIMGERQMEGNDKRVRVTMDQNGTSVTLHPGECLEVVLPSNAGTGYSWQVANPAANVLKSSGKPKIESGPKGGKVGQSENQVFSFVPSGKGTGQLELQYLRPWEKDRKPAKTFLLSVKVE